MNGGGSSGLLGSIENQFSRAASTYQGSAWVQGQVGRRLVAWVRGVMTSCAPLKIWDVGCGPGSLTCLLAEAFPGSEIRASDVAEGMIRYALTRHAHSRIHYHVEDVTEAHGKKEPYDLVFSNAVLHWVWDLQGVFERLRASVGREGRFCFSMYLERTYWELYHVIEEMGVKHDGFPYFMSHAVVLDLLRSAGFEVVAAMQEETREVVGDYTMFSRMQKRRGTAALGMGSFESYTEKKRLLFHLKERFASFRDGGFCLTHHVGTYLASGSR